MEILKPLIDELVKMVKDGKDVISGNLPDVMKQIIAYDSWQACLWIKLSVFLFLCGVMLLVADKFDKDKFSMHGYAVFGAVVMGISVAIFMINYSTLKKIEMAPRVYMIDVLHGYLSHDH